MNDTWSARIIGQTRKTAITSRLGPMNAYAVKIRRRRSGDAPSTRRRHAGGAPGPRGPRRYRFVPSTLRLVRRGLGFDLLGGVPEHLLRRALLVQDALDRGLARAGVHLREVLDADEVELRLVGVLAELRDEGVLLQLLLADIRPRRREAAVDGPVLL